MSVKKIDTLFHGTTKLVHLQSILRNGFYSSYANEKIAGDEYKIVMVSFSNVALIEARNQVNYGDYFIGLKRDWGIRKKLHPVAYTYNNSSYENDMQRLFADSSLIHLWMKIRSKVFKGDIPKVKISSDDFKNTIIKLLNDESLSKETIQTLEKHFENLFLKVSNMRLYIKHYITFDKYNQERYAYNDREWRFIPSEVENKILRRGSSSNIETLIKKFDKKAKPHFKENPLSFKLNDIKFIIVKKNLEIKNIYDTLNSTFGENNVLRRLRLGHLNILSMENIWNDL